MTRNLSKLTLSALAGATSLLAIASPAQAACTITTTTTPGDTVTCTGTTTTVDTTFPVSTPNDRHYEYTSNANLFVNVGSTAIVDGFGLAFTDIGTDVNFLSITNDGSISVNVGNTPTAGGSSAALYVSSVNTPIFYNGTGSVANNGVGNGVEIVSTGTGLISFQNDGAVTSATGNAIDLTSAGGNIFVSANGDLSAVGVGGIGLDATMTGNGSVNLITGGTINADVLGISAATSGTGVVNVTANDAITVANGDGIAATSTTGALTVTNANTGTITANNGDGIETTSTTGSQQVNVQAAISAGGLGVSETSTSGSLGFFNNAAGTVTSAGDAVTLTTGGTGTVTVIQNGVVTSNGGDAIVTTSVDGNQVISGSANIVSAANGIDAIATGLGTIAINRTGGTITAGGDGIEADTTSGTINITTGAITAQLEGVDATSTTGGIVVNATGNVTAAGGDAINLSSTSGPILVSVTGGNVAASAIGADAIQVSSDGAKTVTVAAGRSVTTTGANGFAVYNLGGAGGLTVNNSGTISSAATGRAIVSNSATTVNNLAGATLTGAVTLSTSADVINNSGTYNAAGVNDFFAGTDVINNNVGGTLNVAAGTTIAGLETLNNAGTLTAASGLVFDAGNTALVNNGTLNAAGTIDFGGGTDVLDNNLTGIINVTGATSITGLETFNQSGLINLNTNTLTLSGGAFNNAGTIDTSGSASILGITSFSNSGTMDLAAGTFTVPAVAFTNTGFILADEGTTNISGQTSFANSGTLDLSDGLTNDQLTIFSDFVGSGGSTLMLDVDDDISDQLIITGAASGTTMIDANLIGTGILSPGGVLLVTTGSATADAFVLGNVTGNTSPLLDYGLLQDDDQFLLVTQVNEAGFAPLPVTLIAGDMWYKSAEAVWAQAKLPSDGTNRMGLWGQIYASREKAGDVDRQSINGNDIDVDNEVETDHVGFQAGWGFPMGGMGSIGVTAGFGRADIAGANSDYETKGFNIGAYGMFGGPAGIYGSFLAKHDRFDVEIDRNVFEDASPDGRSNGVDGELGYRFGATSGPVFGVSAGLSHVRTKIDDFSVAGLEYDFDSMTSTRGRVGVRATGSGPISPFFDARVYHEFSGDGDIALSDGIDSYRIRADGRGTWARLEAGIGGPASGLAPMVSAWIDLGDVKGFGGRGSFRF